MEFGLYIRAENYSKMLEKATKAEENKYQSIFLNDHVHGYANEGKENYLEAWTTMTAIGVQTKKIRIGHIVLFNSLRNPAFLAKSISSLDNIINGRYELLIGAGWNESEYKGYDLMEQGRGMPSAKERVDRLEETVKILKLMLNQEKTNYSGDFWQLQGAINMPQPMQKSMRITIGGRKPRMQKITLKHANGMNISARNIDEIKSILTSFKMKAEDLGKSFSDYYMSGFDEIKIAKNEELSLKMAKELSKRLSKRVKLTPDDILKNRMVGTVDQIISKFRDLKDEGIAMYVVNPVLSEGFSDDPIDFFSDNILSEL